VVAAKRTPIDVQAIFRLLELGDYLMPYTIRAMCLLKIADQLTDGPLPLDELASATATDPDALRTSLTYLAASGIFAEVAPDTFALNPMADLLRTDHPYTVRDIFLSPVCCTRAMEGLDHAIRTGEAGFDAVHGRTMWDHFAREPEDGERFDRAMGGVTSMELMAIVRATDWSRFGTVVDVGGGNGRFLASLLRRFKGMRGVLFDLPAVARHAPATFAEAGVGTRGEVVTGSFLVGPIPSGADAYVLKRILYSWSDDEVIGILGRIRTAMKPDSRLFIMEAGRDDGGSRLARRMDLLMLTLSAGQSRSVAEQERLLVAAGLELVGHVATPMFPIIEARTA
jgi:hypothetical protein